MTTLNIDDGVYKVNVQALKLDEDSISAMANYLGESVIIGKSENICSLTVLLLDHKTITGLQVKNSTGDEIFAVEKKINEEANNRQELFRISSLTNPLIIRVQYEAEFQGGTFNGDESLRLVFDEESLKKIE